jgi:hypothetical protein
VHRGLQDAGAAVALELDHPLVETRRRAGPDGGQSGSAAAAGDPLSVRRRKPSPLGGASRSPPEIATRVMTPG